jgi:hypothetical protein
MENQEKFGFITTETKMVWFTEKNKLAEKLLNAIWTEKTTWFIAVLNLRKNQILQIQVV